MRTISQKTAEKLLTVENSRTITNKKTDAVDVYVDILSNGEYLLSTYDDKCNSEYYLSESEEEVMKFYNNL